MEAIYFATQAHSFRTPKTTDMIQHEAKEFVVRLEGKKRDEDIVQAIQYNSKGQKKVVFNEEQSTLFSNIIGNFFTVSIIPEDILLAKGSPSIRRKFLDATISQIDPHYFQALKDYKRILNQKNKYLKSVQSFDSLLETYNAQLCESGSVITHLRMLFLKELESTYTNSYRFISSEKEESELKYACSFSREDKLENIKQDFQNHLEKTKPQELIMKSCLSGPHRDDFDIYLDERPIKSFASQGQNRSMSLALKFASAKLLEERSGLNPILLLDDIFSELDSERRLKIAELISRDSQTFIATPDSVPLPFEGREIRL